MNVTQLVPTSPLDRPYPELEGRPFFAETCTLLRCVRDHDFETLAALCDDDFGIVDVDPSGGSVAVRSRDEWEGWFGDLFATLTALDADTDSEILAYDATIADDLGFSVLEFRQTLTAAGLTATFDCIATIVWKSTPDGWREARWHASVLSADVPEGLRAAS
ncbi:MAG: nuclear transport factor 2 family protein [Acidimicrobiales bacterium]|jgi:ketosteroid isomerase-like protein|nr:nuclear transport factor 2 family protein [Acidimicrobiales bacterium]